ncbi:hypothetical protein LTS10_008224 [Elasticomyces elasticus]|nr:hypothetical protein LTS10_008224 [Elasticomyces elasticus]
MSTMRLPPPPNSHVVLLVDGDDLCPGDIDALMTDLTTHRPKVMPMLDQQWTQWDGSMIIDAMDLLHSHRFSHFCIASGYNSGYGRLASRVREQGAVVYGYGPGGAEAEGFATACDRYQTIGELDGHSDKQAVHATPSTPTSTPVTLAPPVTMSMPAHTHVALSQPIQID